jgi:hypothetical protein
MWRPATSEPSARPLPPARASPSANATTSGATPSACAAASRNQARACAAAWRSGIAWIWIDVLAIVGPWFGTRAVSPSTTVTRSSGRSSSSATSCA